MDSFAASPTVRAITQAGFLIRLSALVVACSVGHLTLGYTIAVLTLAATSYIGLRQRDLGVVSRHPFIALADLLVVGAAVASQGFDSPLLLCSLTTAVLLGLWVDIRFAIPVMIALMAIYGLGAASVLTADGISVFYLLVVPFCYLTVWVMGAVIRRSVLVDQETQRSLADAITAAATTEERKRVARDLHDNLAKTLQAMTLVTSSLKDHTDDLTVGRTVRTLEEMCGHAVDDARRLMSDWRTTQQDPEGSFADQIRAVARSIPAADGFTVRARVTEDIQVVSNEVRYELLTCLKEALLNARQHAAPCTVRVNVVGSAESVSIVVADDGRGINLRGANLPAAPEGHFGTVGIRERMEQIGGTATWASAPGRGTTVTLTAHPGGLVERSRVGRQAEEAS